MAIDWRRIEVIDDDQAAAVRRMKPWEKVAGIFALNRLMRARMAGHLMTQHPEWSETEIQAEIARRLARGSE